MVRPRPRPARRGHRRRRPGRELAPVVDQIVEHHVAGTRFGIGVDPADGLLRQGADGWALTWMDARIDGVPVTPRAGKPVEVNALWIETLDVASRVAPSADAPPWSALADSARDSFLARFLRADGLRPARRGRRPGRRRRLGAPEPAARGLAAATGRLDGAADRQRGASSRPAGHCSRRSACARSHRTTRATGRYHRGSPAERDAAYHQGTVWPWLLGPYVDASRARRHPGRGLLDGLEAHLGEWGLGSISETADGAAPHAATGCPFQAWSVAEVLRVRRARALRTTIVDVPSSRLDDGDAPRLQQAAGVGNVRAS